MSKARLGERAVIYLDSHDHIASIKSKLEGAKGDVLVIVSPSGVKCLQDPLNLKLLRRHVLTLGKETLLVSRDPETRGLAREAGFRVLRSGKSLGIDEEKQTGGKDAVVIPGAMLSSKAVPGIWVWASWVSILLALALPLTGGYLFLPSATVTLRLRSENFSEVVGITASARVSTINPKDLQIPARVVEVTVEASGKAPTTGKLAEPDKAATGRVTFLNYSGETLIIPKGTRVATTIGIQFYTVADVILLSGLQSRTQAEVLAAQGGNLGNVGPLAIDRVLDTALAFKVGVVNETATQGGTEKEVPYVTEEDRVKLKEKVLETARKEGVQQLTNLRREYDSLYPETITAQVIREEWSASPGEKVGEVNLKIQGSVRGLIFSGRDVNQLLVLYFSSPKGGDSKVATGTLRTQPLEVYGWDMEKVSFHLRAQGEIVPILDQGELKKALGGKTPQDAQAYLSEHLALVAWPEVKTAPFWAGQVPKFPWRVSIRILGSS